MAPFAPILLNFWDCTPKKPRQNFENIVNLDYLFKLPTCHLKGNIFMLRVCRVIGFFCNDFYFHNGYSTLFCS